MFIGPLTHQQDYFADRMFDDGETGMRRFLASVA